MAARIGARGFGRRRLQEFAQPLRKLRVQQLRHRLRLQRAREAQQSATAQCAAFDQRFAGLVAPERMQDRIGGHLRIRGEQGGAAVLDLLAQRGWQGAALQPYLDFGRVVTRLPGAFGGAQVTQRRGVRGIGLQAQARRGGHWRWT